MPDAHGFNLKELAAVREQLIERMASYCAELSQALLFNFLHEVAEGLKKMPLDTQMAFYLTSLNSTLDQTDVFEIGDDVIHDLRWIMNHEEGDEPRLLADVA